MNISSKDPSSSPTSLTEQWMCPPSTVLPLQVNCDSVCAVDSLMSLKLFAAVEQAVSPAAFCVDVDHPCRVVLWLRYFAVYVIVHLATG